MSFMAWTSLRSSSIRMPSELLAYFSSRFCALCYSLEEDRLDAFGLLDDLEDLPSRLLLSARLFSDSSVYCFS
jgi:hypothetical protein